LISGNGGSFASPDWIRHLRYVCPQCRGPITLLDGPEAALCEYCGFQGSCISGVVGFLLRPAINEWQEFYEAKAEGQKGDTTRGIGYKFPLQHRYIVDGFRKICRERPIGEAILDVGCGNGLFWQALFGDRPAVGVDFSLRMCVLARTKGMQVYQADATALPFAEAQFDLVYSAEIIQCIADLPAVMRELVRVCRPGGRIIVSTLNRSSLVRNAVLATWRFFHGPITAEDKLPVRRTATEVTDLARTMSLELTRICWTHFPLPWHHCAETTRYALEPLASNMILEFAKPSN
jgi:SAM-dependent methyltransferase